MREKRRNRIAPEKSIKFVDGVRYVNGVKKDTGGVSPPFHLREMKAS